jgi:hypothetical protein
MASHVLEPVIKRSHVQCSIWKWIQKYSFILDSYDVDKHLINFIFIDKTEINFRGKLWVAHEPQLKTFRFLLYVFTNEEIHSVLLSNEQLS